MKKKLIIELLLRVRKIIQNIMQVPFSYILGWYNTKIDWIATFEKFFFLDDLKIIIQEKLASKPFCKNLQKRLIFIHQIDYFI